MAERDTAGEAGSEKPHFLIKDHIDALSNLVDKAYPWAITAENFPDIQREYLALARYIAFDNFVNRLFGSMQQTQSPETKRILERLITSHIRLADEELSQTFAGVSGEIDKETIFGQRYFTQAASTFESLRYAVSLGLIEQINGRNFPILNKITDKDRLMLIIEAVNNRIVWYERQLRLIREIGISSGNNSEKSEDICALAAEKKSLEEYYRELIQKFSHS